MFDRIWFGDSVWLHRRRWWQVISPKLRLPSVKADIAH